MLFGNFFYLFTTEYIYTAILDDGINYYTNDKRYKNKIPKPMHEWIDTQGLDSVIKYNFVDVINK